MPADRQAEGWNCLVLLLKDAPTEAFSEQTCNLLPDVVVPQGELSEVGQMGAPAKASAPASPMLL